MNTFHRRAFISKSRFDEEFINVHIKIILSVCNSGTQNLLYNISASFRREF